MEIIRKKGASSTQAPVSTAGAWKYPFGYNIESGLANWFMRRAEALNRIVRINITGDSITRGSYSSNDVTKSYGAVLRNLMAVQYGDCGYGYINAREGHAGIATSETASGAYGQPKRVTFLDAADTSYTPGLIGNGGFGGEYMRINLDCKCVFNNVVGKKFTLLYVDLPGGGEWGGGKASIEVDGVVVLSGVGDNTVAVDTPRTVTFGVAAGTHTIRLITTNNRFAVSGLICETADTGIQVNRVGRESWKAADWANRADSIHQSWRLTPADLTIVALGTNDTNPGNISQYKTNMTKLINEILFTGSDILLYAMHQPGVGWANAALWPQFVEAQYELAQEFNLGLLDGDRLMFNSWTEAREMGFMGPAPNDFSGGSGSDLVHPGDKGYRYMALSIAQILMA